MTSDRRHHDQIAGRPIHQVRSDGRIVGEIRSDTPIFVISVAAELAGMHAQTLRSYDREGLVSPRRTTGGGRRYSQRDIELLQQVQQLSQDDGVNRAGIRRIMELETQVDGLQERLEDLVAELDEAKATLAAGQRHTHSAAVVVATRVRVGSGANDGALGGVAGRAVNRGAGGAVVGDAVVPWRSHTTAIVTWRPGQ